MQEEQDHEKSPIRDKTFYKGHRELLVIDESLKHYNCDIAREIIKSLDLAGVGPLESLNVLDFGAGIGTLAQIFCKLTGVRPKCVEIDSFQRDLLQVSGFDVYESLNQVQVSFDLVYSSNVLEHILDDVKTIREIYSALNQGGTLFIYVPAHQFLYSQLDEQVGHLRRYSKKDLQNKIASAGFQIQKIEYHDTLGFIASIALKVFGVNKKIGLGSTLSYRIYDTVIFPISKWLDKIRFRKIFGKNLLVVAIK